MHCHNRATALATFLTLLAFSPAAAYGGRGLAVSVGDITRVQNPLPGRPQAAAQDASIRGTVLDAGTMRPLAGAQVVIDGTQRGTLTDAAGRFLLAGLPRAEVTLRVIMLGYASSTQKASAGANNVRFALREAAVELDAVVVTGTPGQTKIRGVGNSVGQVTAAKVVSETPVNSIQQVLGGRIAGVSISAGSGNVGSGGATRIRGVSSLTLSNEPLLYVDGVRVDNNPGAGPTGMRESRPYSRINDFNPEDIASIEIIKGPAAATLYGTEASKGVIQIITKKGLAGKTQFDMSIKMGGNYLRNPAGRLPDNFKRDPKTGSLVIWNGYKQEKALGHDIFQTGPVGIYSASMSGGTERVRYFASGEWDNTNGYVSYNWQKFMRTRANITAVPTDNLDVNVSFGYVRGEVRYAQAAAPYGVWDGLIFGHSDRQNIINGVSQRGWYTAPPELIGQIDARSHIDRITLGVQGNWRPRPWLAQRLNIGMDVGNEVNTRLIPRQPEGALSFFGALGLGDKTWENVNTPYRTLDYSATATAQLRPSIRSATSFGLQYYDKTISTSAETGRIFPTLTVTTVAGAAITTGSEDIIGNKTVGVFLQEQLDLHNRIFLTGAVRADDNSAFGENYSAVLYPKLSGTWVINEEPFWKFDFISPLKLRAAYGKAGKQPDVFAARRLYAATTGPGDAATVTPTNLGNPDLQPEKASELEVGLDGSMFNNRLSVGFTYYAQRTTDAIYSATVAPSSGFQGTRSVNAGVLTNRGTEFKIDLQALRRTRLQLDFGGIFSTNHSKLLSLGGLPETTGNQQLRIGYPLGGYWSTIITHAELDANNKPINLMCQQLTGPDLPCLQSSARVYWGPAIPTWEAALSSTVSYGLVRLFVSVDGRGGFYRSNNDVGHAAYLMGSTESVNGYLDGRGPNPYAVAYATNSGQWGSSLLIMKGGFAKLREVSATFTLPRRWASQFRASTASLSLAGRNLAILWQAQTDVYGRREVDPEIQRPGSGGLSNGVQSTLPPSTQILATLRVGF